MSRRQSRRSVGKPRRFEDELQESSANVAEATATESSSLSTAAAAIKEPQDTVSSKQSRERRGKQAMKDAEVLDAAVQNRLLARSRNRDGARITKKSDEGGGTPARSSRKQAEKEESVPARANKRRRSSAAHDEGANGEAKLLHHKQSEEAAATSRSPLSKRRKIIKEHLPHPTANVVPPSTDAVTR